MDGRLKGISSNWVYGDGGVISTVYANNIPVDYSQFVTRSTNFNSLPSVKITDESLGVEQRPAVIRKQHVDSKGRKWDYWKIGENNTTLDESIAPVDFMLTDLPNRILVSKNNSTNKDRAENNIIRVMGVDNKVYKVNFKEVFTDDKVLSGTATLEATDKTGTWGEWAPKVNGDAVASNNNKFTLKFSNGQLFDFTGKNGKTIVTKLKITNKKDGSVKEVTGEAGKRIEVVTTYNKIGFTNGIFFIDKLEYCEEERNYLIEAWYNEAKLGELDLTIPGEIVDIGDATVVMDSRLNQLSEGWVYADGVITKTIEGATRSNYPKLVSSEKGNLKNLSSGVTINEVKSIEGRDSKGRIYTDYAGKKFRNFKVTGNGVKDESLALLQFTLSDIGNYLVVSKDNGTNADLLNNKFVLEGDNGKLYKGNFIEKFTGEKTYELTATLTVTANKEDWGGWKEGESGAATVVKTGANKNDFNLKFDNGAGLFNITGFGNKSIITYVELIAEDGTVIKGKTGNATGNGEDIYADTPENYRIGFHDDHFYVTKDGYLTEDKTYTVVAYHQDVVMGKIKLTMKKEEAIDIGSAKVIMDARLKALTNTMSWVYYDGTTVGIINQGPRRDYSEFVTSDKSGLKNLIDVYIEDAISMEGRDNKGEVWGDTVKSKHFRSFKVGNSVVGESLAPVMLNLLEIGNSLIVSMNNGKAEHMESKFVLEAANGK